MSTKEIRGHEVAVEIRSLILERLPLFLHEPTNARPRLPYSWLNNEKNFIVRTFERLTVTKSLNFGTVRVVDRQDASAVARREDQGPIELWLAINAQVDMHE
jgi:hypothetical protein